MASSSSSKRLKIQSGADTTSGADVPTDVSTYVGGSVAAAQAYDEPPPADVASTAAPAYDEPPGDVASAAAPTYCTYTLRAYYGDPTEELPSWMKTQKISAIQDFMREQGYAEPFNGTKAVLLGRIKDELSFVEFRVDSSECLQGVLNVVLSTWAWDESHCFRASMPRRGDCPWGARKLGDSDDWLNLLDMQQRGSFTVSTSGPRFYSTESLERYVRAEKKRGLDAETVDGIVDYTIGPHHDNPLRVVNGSSSHTEEPSKGYDEYLDHDIGGALSVGDVALEVGDTIKYVFDFGDHHLITVRVVAIAQEEEHIPLKDWSHAGAARAVVVSTGGRQMHPQYPGEFQ